MRELLRGMPAGLPADCLLARIKGRRSLLLRDWQRLLLARQPLEAIPAAPWRNTATGGEDWARHALQGEYYWAFSSLNEQLRRSTAPFFWLAELRTIAICLRLISGGTTTLTPLLHFSLLAKSLKTLLLTAAAPAAAVTGLTAVLAGYDSRFAGVAEVWHSGGPGGLENILYDLSLTRAGEAATHPAMRCYLALMIDSRNLTTVAKRLRWRLSAIPPLLPGGTLSLHRLAKLFARRDNAAVLQLAMRLGGEASYSETADPEQVLYEAQRRVLQRLARQTDGVGTILDYLWRCSNEAANISLLGRLDSAGSELVAAELRQ